MATAQMAQRVLGDPHGEPFLAGGGECGEIDGHPVTVDAQRALAVRFAMTPEQARV
ncbi:MAG: hypothetical protein DHS20C19_15000 [Acidimicrobiales bacterium]|nr:MAG: hypothetical protein DHS20C19_15000 [Acidimicrobiales bacterium]